MAKDNAKINNGSIIESCTCENKYQDRVYGPGKRVKNGAAGGYRCTGCGVKK